MGKRAGSLLERHVSKLLASNGFNVQKNAFINGYEIDVYAKVLGFSLACQCKQYEKSYINVKDLLHQWSSKKNEINVDRVLVVIYGQPASPLERQLAKRLKIMLWDESDLDIVEQLPADEFNKRLELGKLNGYNKIDDDTREKMYNALLIFLGIILLPVVIGIVPLVLGIYRIYKKRRKESNP